MQKSFYENDGRVEIILSDQSDKELFEKIFEEIKKAFAAKLIKKLDGTDERYWDFEVEDGLLCLHLQHYMGISIFPLENSELNKVAEKIATYLSKKEY